MTVQPKALDLPILRDAAPESVESALRQATIRAFDPGQLVIDFDDPTTDVFFVMEGIVRVQLRTAGGRDLIMSEIAAGGMFGEIAAIDHALRSANVTAVTAARLCSLPAQAFLDAACSSPAACLGLLRSLTSMVRRLSVRVLEREALPVRARLGTELLRLSRPRQKGEAPVGLGTPRVVSPPPTHQELAARIGARREVISRELAQLLRQGLVERVRGGFVLPRPQALQDWVDAGEG